MKLYIIRHAHAELRHEFAKTGRPDRERPLVEKGFQRMDQVLSFFHQHEEKIDKFLVSPYTRCQETASICHQFFPEAEVQTSDHLAPDHSAKRLYELIQKQELDSLAVIGHEPDLGQFISWLLFRQATDHFPMKKAGIAKMDLYKDGRAYLKWMISPKLLQFC